MSGSVLLDTNIVIACFANDAAALSALSKADDVWIPSIVLGELCYGALNSTKQSGNLARVHQFANAVGVAPLDRSAGETYGRIKDALRRNGTPIPENDIWIAAIATARDMELATRDTHFSAIEGIRLQHW